MVPGIVGMASALARHIPSTRIIEEVGRSILSSFNVKIGCCKLMSGKGMLFRSWGRLHLYVISAFPLTTFFPRTCILECMTLRIALSFLGLLMLSIHLSIWRPRNMHLTRRAFPQDIVGHQLGAILIGIEILTRSGIATCSMTGCS